MPIKDRNGEIGGVSAPSRPAHPARDGLRAREASIGRRAEIEMVETGRLAGLRGAPLQSAVAGLLGGRVCHVPGLVQEGR